MASLKEKMALAGAINAWIAGYVYTQVLGKGSDAKDGTEDIVKTEEANYPAGKLKTVDELFATPVNDEKVKHHADQVMHHVEKVKHHDEKLKHHDEKVKHHDEKVKHHVEKVEFHIEKVKDHVVVDYPNKKEDGDGKSPNGEKVNSDANIREKKKGLDAEVYVVNHNKDAN